MFIDQLVIILMNELPSHIFLLLFCWFCLPYSYLFSGVLYICWKQLLYQVYALKILSPSLWAPIHFLNGDFRWTHVLNFNLLQFIKFFPEVTVLLCYFMKSLPVPNSGACSLMWSSRHIIIGNWFCVWCEGIRFIFWKYDSSIDPVLFMKRVIFSSWLCSVTSLINQGHA